MESKKMDESTTDLAEAAGNTDNESSSEVEKKPNENENKKDISNLSTENKEESSSKEIKSDLSSNSFDKDKQQENVHSENGQYIYTDPTTKAKYIWNDEKKEWTAQNQPIFDGTNYNYTDSNGVKFVWNSSKNEWEKAEVQETSKHATPDFSQNSQYGFDGVHHTYTDPRDNTVYIWDKDKNAWFPKVDDDFLAHYQMNYGFVDNTGDEKKKEELKEAEKKEKEASKRKATPQEPTWFELDEQHNTKVYVSNLPLDITEQEFVDLMQKCGLVMKDITSNKWKIKLYTDPEKNCLKGDALCTYIKKESVELAINVLDGYEFKGKKIEVQRAKFEMKGDYNPALKPKKKKKKEKEKEKKIQQKLFDWRSDKLRGERESHERTVIIKNLFDPKIFDEHVELILEYSQDLREECSKCGVIRKLTIHDKHPEGVAQVAFSDAEEADLCIKLLNNRWFGQRRITAETWDGKTKYKVVENAEETQKRLEKWNKYLESEKGNEKA